MKFSAIFCAQLIVSAVALSMSGAAQVSDGIWMYRLTDDGLATDISAPGTKYSKDTDLN